MTDSKIIVATQTDDAVRIYVGHPSNGGLHQTGQFTTAHAIEPTTLANMAVDLSASLGWLNGTPLQTERVPTLHANTAPAVVALPAAPTDSPVSKWHQIVACPEPGCNHTARRNNMGSHLQSRVHGYNKQRAWAVSHELPTVDNPAAPATRTNLRVAWPRIMAFIEAHGPVGVAQIRGRCARVDGSALRKRLNREVELGNLKRADGKTGPMLWVAVDQS